MGLLIRDLDLNGVYDPPCCRHEIELKELKKSYQIAFEALNDITEERDHLLERIRIARDDQWKQELIRMFGEQGEKWTQVALKKITE